MILFFLPRPDAALVAVNHLNDSSDLWVNAELGNDTNDGSSPERAFRTIQTAAAVAQPGITVHIAPGIYRESIVPAMDGSEKQPIIYQAEAGKDTVHIRGSIPASTLIWTRLETNSIGLPKGVDPTGIFYADLSSWNLTRAPRFIIETDRQGEIISRLMPAREPDWKIVTEWKANEFWWLAEGGTAVAACDPRTDSNPNCDLPWRSFTQLTDPQDDIFPKGVEAGSLSSFDDLSGATLVAMDSQHAHYIYRRTILKHDIEAGRITVDEDCDNDGSPGLGWGSKYYIENHPALLDHPGEWWFDAERGLLYIWPPDGEDPARLSLEISQLETGFNLTNRSHIVLDGLSIELFNKQAFIIRNENPSFTASSDVIRNSRLRYANEGIVLYQYMNEGTPPTHAIDGFRLEDSEIAFMDTSAIDMSYWWPDAPAAARFNHSGVRNTTIRNNYLHDVGFYSEARSGVGVRVFFPDKLRFENNRVERTAHAGAQFHLSVIDSVRDHGFGADEIKTGDILIRNNLFERNCMQASDCGALKFGGSSRPDTHVFRDVLIMENVFRETMGWSQVSLLRGAQQSGDGNGFYLDYASGVHVFRNIAYDNTGAGFKLSCLWVDGDAIFYNNISANNLKQGFKLTSGGKCDSHTGSVNTRLVNNIVANNSAHAIQFESRGGAQNLGNLVVDYNLYFQNGGDEEATKGNPALILFFQDSNRGQYFKTLDEVRAGLSWEAHGVEGNPALTSYPIKDYDFPLDSWVDFRPTVASVNVLNRGTTNLSESVLAMLAHFEVTDSRFGSAYEIGAYEFAEIMPTPKQPAVADDSHGCFSPMTMLAAASLVLMWQRQNKRHESRPQGPIQEAGNPS